MDQILGVVRDNDVETCTVMFFEKQHALVDPIEAVGFGSGSLVRADREMDLRKAGFQIADGVEGAVVVRVAANKEMIVLVVDGGGVVLDHPSDNGVLVPERYKDRDVLFAVLFGAQGPGRAGPKPPPQPGPQADRVQSQ